MAKLQTFYDVRTTDDEKHIVPPQIIVKEDKSKFVLDGITDRIFLIVTNDQLNETGNMYLSLPMIVYGLLKVDGPSFDKSYVSFMHISDDVSVSKELDSLSEEARRCVFSKND